VVELLPALHVMFYIMRWKILH